MRGLRRVLWDGGRGKEVDGSTGDAVSRAAITRENPAFRHVVRDATRGPIRHREQSAARPLIPFPAKPAHHLKSSRKISASVL